MKLIYQHYFYLSALTGLLSLIVPVSVESADKKPIQQSKTVAVKMKPEQRAFFEKKIRPVLVKHCFSCHSTKSKELGGKLLLDSRNGMKEGGESGPTLVVGDPAKSLLIQALKYDSLEMPPEKPLPKAVINDFIRWINMGAPDPRGDRSKKHSIKMILDNSDGALWSFQPIQKPLIPKTKTTGWSQNRLDQFVLKKMEVAGLSPTKDATPQNLIRRLIF